MGRTQYVRGHYRNGHYVSAHVRNDMGPTPQWVWNLFIGIGALTGLILFASAISSESSSKKRLNKSKPPESLTMKALMGWSLGKRRPTRPASLGIAQKSWGPSQLSAEGAIPWRRATSRARNTTA